MPPPLIFLYSPSFGANRRKLEEHGIFNKTADYNRRLAALSQKAADGKAFVAGDISPTGLFLSPLGEASSEELVELFADCQYMISKPLCIVCDDADILEAALRAYQGRPLYEGSLPDSALAPLVSKYGVII